MDCNKSVLYFSSKNSISDTDNFHSFPISSKNEDNKTNLCHFLFVQIEKRFSAKNRGSGIYR